jgi:hypothetical protein
MAKKQQGTETVRAEEAVEQREELRVAETPDEPEEEREEEEEPEQLNLWEASHRVVSQAMKEGSDTTLSELSHDADQLVIKSGGKSNVDRAWNTIYDILASLQEMGMLEMTEEISIHPLHRLPSANGRK